MLLISVNVTCSSTKDLSCYEELIWSYCSCAPGKIAIKKY